MILPSLKVVFEVMCQTLVLDSTQGAGFIDVIPHENVAKNHASSTALGIMNVKLSFFFYITIAGYDTVDVNLQKYQEIVEVALVHNKNEHCFYLPRALSSNNDSVTSTAHYISAPNRLKQLKKYKSVWKKARKSQKKLPRGRTVASQNLSRTVRLSWKR